MRKTLSKAHSDKVVETLAKQATDHLLSLIPHDILRVFLSQEYCEIDEDFLCFALPYEILSQMIPKDMVVIDFGCYMAAQAYFFQEHAAYVGVDCYEVFTPYLRRFQPENAIHVSSSIQACAKALQIVYPNAYAICHAVPDEKARQIVSRLYQNHCVSYPGVTSDVNGRLSRQISRQFHILKL